MTVTFQIKGLKELERALRADMQKAARVAGTAVAGQIKQVLVQYPPKSEANRPRTFQEFSIASHKRSNRWYERGFGPRWARKDGSVGGSPSSESLDRSWAVKRKDWGGMVGSRASYSPAVHSHKEQAKFHGRRGWKTDKQAVADVQRSGIVDRIVKQTVDKIVKGRKV